MKITLSVVKGPNRGRSFSFEGHDTFIVGRGRTAHLQLPTKDRYFSRNHFMIEVNPPLCRLTDMASRNGTYVNSERVSEADLRDGDTIRGGNTTIRVQFEADGSPKATHRAVAQRDAYPPASSRQARPPQDDPAETLDAPDRPITAAETSGHFGQFDLIRELGRGGMGVVYLATKRGDRREVALKTILPQGPVNDRDIQQFLREASILKQLRHPNIVEFYDFGNVDGRVFLSMEYVAGDNLQRVLKRSGPLSVPQATRIICELLRALSFAHSRQFVHRDIKPANVLLARQERKLHVKLSDFGLARVYQASRLSGLTMQGDMGGSVAFMPPEQITNYREVQPASDLYSTAASLYTLLTGCHIFDFPDRLSQRLVMILQEDPVPILSRRTDIPRQLADVIHRGLQREPSDRYVSAAAMRQALQPFVR
jgi:serine/threonine-protein kinase